MSRSRKKSPVSGITKAKSEKSWKTSQHRQRRALQRRWLQDALGATEPAGVYADPLDVCGEPWCEDCGSYKPGLDDILAQPRGNEAVGRGMWGPKDGKRWLRKLPRFQDYWAPGEWEAWRQKLLRK